MRPPPDLVGRLRAAGCVFADDEARLLTDAAADASALRALVDRRVAGEPLEHLLGWVEFCGRRLGVGPGVFVPRARTEFLAEQAVAAAVRGAGSAGRGDAGPAARPVVLDLCCGCGAVGAAVLAAVPTVELHAVDLDPVAVAVARSNLPDAVVHTGDLYAALPVTLRGRLDVLVANAPYVPTGAIGAMPPEAREHEPTTALDGGADGLDVLRRIVWEASAWLSPGGTLLVESSARQAPVLAVDLVRAGLRPEVRSDDDRGATVVLGR